MYDTSFGDPQGSQTLQHDVWVDRTGVAPGFDGGLGTPAGLGLCPGPSEAFHAQESALMKEKG